MWGEGEGECQEQLVREGLGGESRGSLNPDVKRIKKKLLKRPSMSSENNLCSKYLFIWYSYFSSNEK